MFEVTCQLEFEAAHRLLGYDGPCNRVHGHHYVAEVTIRGQELDPLGMLVDFGVLKSSIGGRIDATWDHRLLLHARDISNDVDGAVALGEFNPTAEHMARLLFRVAQEILSPEATKRNIEVVRVRLYETPDCWVDYEEE